MEGATTSHARRWLLRATPVTRNVLIVWRTAGSSCQNVLIVTPCEFFSGCAVFGSVGWKPLSGLSALVSLPPANVKTSASAGSKDGHAHPQQHPVEPS